MTLGFLGSGAITSAMVAGLNSAGDWPHAIRLSPRNASVSTDLARRYPLVSVASTNQQVVEESGAVVIAVRPQIAPSVLAELRFRPDQHVLSLVSGLSVGRLAGLVAPATRITRAVPLPSAARRRSPTAIYPNDPEAFALFTLLGEAFAAESERQFDAFCTVTATMAAYYRFAETAAAWLTRQGIAEQPAGEYIARIFFGLAETALHAPGRTFHALAADHATRGGVNEQVVNHLAAHGVFDRYSEALDGIMRRVTSATLPADFTGPSSPAVLE